MIPIKTTIFQIEPVTAVRTTGNQGWLLNVSYETAKKYDDKKLMLTGKKGGSVALKKQMERYYSFKETMRLMALKEGFVMPVGYFAIWFYVPMPESWRKSKIDANVNKPKTTSPDIDNYAKAVFDGLMPRKNKRSGEKGADDRRIHSFAAFKVWVRRGEGCIKIVEYNEDEFMKAFKWVS
jgi:Holliday junction resolvase RusA-like endonuclease